MPVLAGLGLIAALIAIRQRRRRGVRRWAAGTAIALFVLAAAVLVVA